MKQLLLVLSVIITLTSCGNESVTPEVEEKPITHIMTIFGVTGDTLQTIELSNFWYDDVMVRGTRMDGTQFYTNLPNFIEYKTK